MASLGLVNPVTDLGKFCSRDTRRSLTRCVRSLCSGSAADVVVVEEYNAACPRS